MAGRKARFHLPFAAWPAEDKDLWRAALADESDPFSDLPATRLATSSLKRLHAGWRRFLAFLSLEEPFALEERPALRVTPARVQQFARHLAATNIPRSVAIQVEALYGAAKLMLPDCDWTWLRAMKTKFFRAAPAAQKGPVITSDRLLGLGEQLMHEANSKLASSLRISDAIRYRDGLIIALMAVVPLRRRNVSDLEIGRSVIEEGGGTYIVFGRHETKSSKRIEFTLPKFLDAYLKIYLNSVRPRLLRHSSSDALWINSRGERLSYSAVWNVIDKHTTERLGFHVAPHDFRDAAVTTWALADPGKITIARDLLGHTQLATTINHYSRAKNIEASRSQAQIVYKLRRGEI